MPAIDIIDSAGNDYRYNLPEDGSMLLIGTDADCSVSLPHIADLLPQHCTISLQEEGYVISSATEGATLLAEGQATEAAVLVPRAVYNIGSAMLMYDDAATAAPAETQAPPTTAEPKKKAKKKKKKSSAGSLGDSSILATASYTEEDGALHIIFRRLYVIIILAAAFLAGLTLRYWMITGKFLINDLL